MTTKQYNYFLEYLLKQGIEYSDARKVLDVHEKCNLQTMFREERKQRPEKNRAGEERNRVTYSDAEQNRIHFQQKLDIARQAIESAEENLRLEI